MLTLPPQDAVLNLANWLKWVTETNGENRGEAVDAIIRVTGLDPTLRAPWCAAFVAACGYAVLRDQWPLKKVAGCQSLYDDALAKGMVRSIPEHGSIFLLFGTAADGTRRFHHAGFCLEMNSAGFWSTVEGNTNAGGSPEGTGVFVRQRTFSATDAFIHWWG